MRISEREVSTMPELVGLVAAGSNVPAGYSVAVEGLIFNDRLEWIMMHRGHASRDEIDKLEGIGGRYEGDVDFRTALQREIREEVGTDARIDIIGFVEVKYDRVYVTKEGQPVANDWVIVSFLCKHRGGELQIMEPHKNQGFIFISDFDVSPERLTSSARMSLRSLKEQWSKYRSMLEERG